MQKSIPYHTHAHEHTLERTHEYTLAYTNVLFKADNFTKRLINLSFLETKCTHCIV